MKVRKLQVRRTLAIVMMFLVSFSSVFAVNPSQQIIGTGNKEVTYFFANGNSITIKERPDGEEGALITWGESGEALVPANTNVFGGAHDDDTPMTTDIIMEGGTVNAIYGGGLHKSNVSEAYIEIKAGTINFQVCGGGAAALTNACGCEYASWDDGDAKDSPCRVDKATIIVEDGATFNGEGVYGYSLLYGGGQGISYTGEVIMNINGGNFVDTYVTAGGSNGYTGTSDLNIASGDFKCVVQGINRGTMDEINMNITGGSFNNLYIGGETADASVTGTYEKANVVISGDNIKITNLLPGSNGNSVEDDASKVELVLGKDVLPENITKKEIAETLFGISGDYDTFELTFVKLNKESVEMLIGDTVTLEAIVEAGIGVEDTSVIWETENPNIATVTDGVVKGIEVGRTTITVKSNIDETKVATCNVTVLRKSNVDTDNKDEEKEEIEKWNNPFEDVKEDAWYYESIQYVNENGLFKGMAEDTFGADISMTRGMVVEVLYRLAGAETTENATFDDVSEDAYYSKAIAWAQKNGIVEGIGDNKFAPDREVTREEFVTILYRYAKLMNEDLNAEFDMSDYEDKDEISESAEKAFQWAIQNEIVKGISENKIAPQKTAARAEVATMIMRFSLKES